MSMVNVVVNMYKRREKIDEKNYDYGTFMRMFRIHRALTLLVARDANWLSDGKLLSQDIEELKKTFNK